MAILVFKYISCYSLSSEYGAQGAVAIAFKYISCYSLSATATSKSLFTVI